MSRSDRLEPAPDAAKPRAAFNHPLRLLLTLGWTGLLAFFFAHVEIQVEGAAGWAAGLPTWRIDHRWWLDVFWGGRVMTGYHAWLFPCMALFFHFPMVFSGIWSWRREARVLACIMLFWLGEDFLWFVMNPAYGLARFRPQYIPWHVHWWGPAPSDYWVFLGVAVILFGLSCQSSETPSQAFEPGAPRGRQ